MTPDEDETVGGDPQEEGRGLMSACPFCGSTSPRRGTTPVGDGECSNVKGCNERRCRRRIELDKKRNPSGRQCFSTFGLSSVRFCLMREDHEGMHLNGTQEWSGGYQHPLAAAIRAGISKKTKS